MLKKHLSIIITQLIMNTNGYGGILQDELSITFFALGILYLILFGMFAGIVLFAFLMGIGAFYSFRSDYHILDNVNGFTIEAERLNTKVVKEYDLKKGDVIGVSHQSDDGGIFISIKKINEEPIFYGNTYDEFDDFSVEIQEAGCYQIECSGRKAKGKVEFTIK